MKIMFYFFELSKKHSMLEEEYQKQIIDLQSQISVEKCEAAKLNR